MQTELQVQSFLHAYRKLFQRHSPLGELPPVAWGRDGQIVKQLLKLYPYERLTHLLGQFFASNDQWFKKRGYSLPAFRDALPALLLGGIQGGSCHPTLRTGKWTPAGQVRVSQVRASNRHNNNPN